MPSKNDLNKFRGEIGESIVAYELMKSGWDVMKHLGGQGYDLLATKGTVSRRIEVKTTDPKLKTGNARRQLTVASLRVRKEGSRLLHFLHSWVFHLLHYPSEELSSIWIGHSISQ